MQSAGATIPCPHLARWVPLRGPLETAEGDDVVALGGTACDLLAGRRAAPPASSSDPQIFVKSSFSSRNHSLSRPVTSPASTWTGDVARASEYESWTWSPLFRALGARIKFAPVSRATLAASISR